MTRPLLAVFVAAAAAAATAASPVAPAAAAAESASDAPAAAGLVRASAASYASIAGDPGYLSPDAAVLLEGWNFCNEALAPPQFSTRPSPRWADCTLGGGASQVVAPSDNALGPGDPFPLPGFNATTDVNLYAETKELYLGALCSRAPAPASAPAAVGANWSYHTIMFKSGNMDVAANICPETAPAPPLRRPAARARRARRAPSARALPAASAAARASFRAGSAAGLRAGFNNLLMNQPLVQVTPSAERAVPYGGRGLVGWTSGTYDVNASWTPAEVAAVTAALEAYTAAWVAYRFAEVDGAPPGPQPTPPALLTNKSYVAAVWYRNVTSGSLVFMHIQSTSAAAPWLMNYLKLMDTNGVGSGYDWNEAGDVFGPSPAYLSRLQVTYTVLQRSKGGFGGLYVPCHGGCWKLNGDPCDGDLDSDITRYICFIAESGSQGCSAKNQGACPPFHILSGSHVRVYPNDTARFPHSCYSGHCAPGACDPYSNPGPQELMMLLPCSEWAEHGYPTTPGELSGVPLTLDVGAIGARVALAGVEPADVGAAERARRGWAPLPPLSELPPYPGWTRSFAGFDFGQEQPSSGLVRYEFTAVDLTVLAAAPAVGAPSPAAAPPAAAVDYGLRGLATTWETDDDNSILQLVSLPVGGAGAKVQVVGPYLWYDSPENSQLELLPCAMAYDAGTSAGAGASASAGAGAAARAPSRAAAFYFATGNDLGAVRIYTVDAVSGVLLRNVSVAASAQPLAVTAMAFNAASGLLDALVYLGAAPGAAPAAAAIDPASGAVTLLAARLALPDFQGPCEASVATHASAGSKLYFVQQDAVGWQQANQTYLMALDLATGNATRLVPWSPRDGMVSNVAALEPAAPGGAELVLYTTSAWNQDLNETAGLTLWSVDPSRGAPSATAVASIANPQAGDGPLLPTWGTLAAAGAGAARTVTMLATNNNGRIVTYVIELNVTVLAAGAIAAAGAPALTPIDVSGVTGGMIYRMNRVVA